MPKLLPMAKESDSRLHLNLKTLKFFDPSHLLSFCSKPMHSVDCIEGYVYRVYVNREGRTIFYSPTSLSCQTSIVQNQGNGLFRCPCTWGTIMLVLTLKSWGFNTLYRSRRSVLAPRSTIAFCERTYTRELCWTVDSTACTSAQARDFSLCVRAGRTSCLSR